MGHRHHRLGERRRGASIATVTRCDGWPARPAPCKIDSRTDRFHVRAVGLAIFVRHLLGEPQAFKRSVLARSASRSALYSDMALAPSVARSSFLNCAPAHFRSWVSSANVRSY